MNLIARAKVKHRQAVQGVMGYAATNFVLDVDGVPDATSKAALDMAWPVLGPVLRWVTGAQEWFQGAPSVN